MTSSRRFSAAVGVLLLAFTFQADGQTAALREAWRDAYDAIRNSGAALPETRRLRRYALYPYLESAALIQGLKSSDQYDNSITGATQFLARFDGTAIADAFRRELLFTLSELGAWNEFIGFYRNEVANISRECEYLRARVDLDQTENLAALVEARWETARRLDAACEPAFQWLRDIGVLDAALTARRVELLLAEHQTEFARVIAARLPAEQASAYRQWADMLEAPLDTLDALTQGTLTPLHPDALSAVWSRASIRSPGEALARMPDVLALVASGEDDVQQMRRELALGLSWDRRSEALEVFAQLGADDHDDYSLGWYARNALWNGEWAIADQALVSLSEPAQDQSDWLYWRARAAMQLGRLVEARSLYAALLDRDNFYSAMTAARLGEDIVPNDQPADVQESLVSELAERDGLVRARELLLVGERVAATREWQYATRSLSSDELIAAMQLAGDWGWHDITVATATRAEVFFDYQRLYPLAYEAEIEEAAAQASFNPALISGLIRQESMFRPDAVSSAGAIGLMQLGPSTARVTAQRLGLPRPERADLFDPASNTQLGAATLRSGMERFAQQIPVALAAYNAGPAAAERWLPESPLDSDIWIENIPFNETREYVRRVLWNEIVYRWLRADGAPVDTAWLTGTIAEPAAAD